jgi:hypothetical protein
MEQQTTTRKPNKARLVLCVLAAVLVTGAIAYQRASSFMSPSVQSLMAVESRRAEKEVSTRLPRIPIPPPRSVVKKAWADVRTQMRRYGTSGTEIESVCRAADLTKKTKGDIYAIPVYARPAWVHFHKMWVFGYAWESSDSWDGQYSSHCRTCIFDSAPPHALLSEAGCM